MSSERAGFDDAICVGDTNGTISTGSVAMGLQSSPNLAQHSGLVVLSIAPAPATANGNFFMFF